MTDEVRGEVPLIVNKLAAIVVIVLGFLILAAGYRYRMPVALIGGSAAVGAGLALLVIKIVRRNKDLE